MPTPFIACTALSIRLVQTWLSSAGCAGICGRLRSYSLTTLTPLPILWVSITSVLSRPVCTSIHWWAARSICEYCLAADTSDDTRLVASSMSVISCSVSSA